MRKLIRPTLCLMLSLLFMFAAGGCTIRSPAATDSAAPIENMPEEPESGKPETLRIAFFQQQNTNIKALEERLALFSDKLLDGYARVRLEPVIVPSNSYEAFTQAIADVDLYGMNIETYWALIEQDLFADLTDEIAEREALYEATQPKAWDAVRVDGRIYAFPTIYSMDYNGSFESGILVRRDILDALNLPLPATPRELIEAATAAKEAGLAYRVGYRFPYPPYALHRTYGQWPFFVSGNSVLLYHTDGTVEAYPESDVYLQDVEALRPFKEANVLHVISNSEYQALLQKWDWFAAFYPVYLPDDPELAAQIELIQFAPDAVNFRILPIVSMTVCVSAKADRRLAVDVLEALYANQEVYDTFVFGEEGKDWRAESGSFSTREDSELFMEYRHKPLDRGEFGMGDPVLPIPESSMTAFPAAMSFTFAPTGDYAGMLYSQAGGLFGSGGIMNIRVGMTPLTSLGAAIERLKNGGLDSYVKEAQEQYTNYLTQRSGGRE